MQEYVVSAKFSHCVFLFLCLQGRVFPNREQINIQYLGPVNWNCSCPENVFSLGKGLAGT